MLRCVTNGQFVIIVTSVHDVNCECVFATHAVQQVDVGRVCFSQFRLKLKLVPLIFLHCYWSCIFSISQNSNWIYPSETLVIAVPVNDFIRRACTQQCINIWVPHVHCLIVWMFLCMRPMWMKRSEWLGRPLKMSNDKVQMTHTCSPYLSSLLNRLLVRSQKTNIVL